MAARCNELGTSGSQQDTKARKVASQSAHQTVLPEKPVFISSRQKGPTTQCEIEELWACKVKASLPFNERHIALRRNSCCSGLDVTQVTAKISYCSLCFGWKERHRSTEGQVLLLHMWCENGPYAKQCYVHVRSVCRNHAMTGTNAFADGFACLAILVSVLHSTISMSLYQSDIVQHINQKVIPMSVSQHISRAANYLVVLDTSFSAASLKMHYTTRFATADATSCM